MTASCTLHQSLTYLPYPTSLDPTPCTLHQHYVTLRPGMQDGSGEVSFNEFYELVKEARGGEPCSLIL